MKAILKKSTLVVFILLLSISCTTTNQERDKNEIMTILNLQQEAWSQNDLEGFMEGYWKSDSLFFYSGAQLKNGWQQTLNSYQKNYPDMASTGNLKFKIAKIAPIDSESYFVMGEYILTRQVGNSNGTFMIIFKKINGEWKIIADSSC
ncbi:MAG: DUF4440 domain-containing protein [Maribacter sp.]